MAAKRQGPSPEEVIARQKEDASRTKQVVATSASNVPATPEADTRTPEERYVDQIAPSTIAGTLIKFAKGGKFECAENGEVISPDTAFVCLADETFIGWIRFNGEGEPPDRVQGRLYKGFVLPPRATLGDTDETKWENGLDGAPEDPWKHQQMLVLQNRTTGAIYTFATTSETGRRAGRQSSASL
jgi:hypothetical protein